MARNFRLFLLPGLEKPDFGGMLPFRIKQQPQLSGKVIRMVPDNAADRQHLMEADEIAALTQKLGKMIYEDNRGVPPDQLILIGTPTP